MASFTKVNDFVVNLANAIMNADTFKVALSNTTQHQQMHKDGNGVLAILQKLLIQIYQQEH